MQRILNKLSIFPHDHFLPRGILSFLTNASYSIDISQLNKYQNKEWSIKGVVLKKGSIKAFDNIRGTGKLFNFVMIDDTSDVKVVAFNQQVNELYDLIEVNKSYILSNGIIKLTDPRFNATKCDYEIMLNEGSNITQITEDNLHIPDIKFKFVDFSHLKDCDIDSFIDVIGVAHEIKDPSIFISKKNNKEIVKRDILLVDSSGNNVLLTLWDEDVEKLNNLEHPIIVVKGARVRDFNGRSLIAGLSTIIQINPDNVQEAKLLSKWYEASGRDTTFTSQSDLLRASWESKKVKMSEIECTGEEKNDFYSVEATVSRISTKNIFIKSCVKCKKKLVDHNNGSYSCIKCNTESPEFKYRLELIVNISDDSGFLYMMVYHKTAAKLLGVSVEELDQMLESRKNEEIVNLLHNVLHKKILCIVKVNNDTYNDKMRAVLYDLSAINNEPV